MQLEQLLTQVRDQVLAAAALGDERTQQIAGSLTSAVSASVQLAIVNALSGAADEITAALLDYPGSPAVSVRLDGSDVRLDVRSAETPVTAEPRADDADNSARISLRLPESLKTDIEAAAAGEGLSVNTWLVRAANAALRPDWASATRMAATWAESAGKHGGSSHRVTGWING